MKVLDSCQASLKLEKSVEFDDKAGKGYQVFIHHSAVVDPDVHLGNGTIIWHFSHILTGSKIGEKCNIGQNVVVGPNVQIGKGCKIQNSVSVYEGVTLGDFVFCGPSMVFTNVMNPRALVSRKKEYIATNVCDGVSFGANCTIVGGITIGEYAFVGAGAVVIKDVSAYALVVGNPARQIGWVSRFGKKMDLPLKGDGKFICPHTGEVYILQQSTVSLKQG